MLNFVAGRQSSFPEAGRFKYNISITRCAKYLDRKVIEVDVDNSRIRRVGRTVLLSRIQEDLMRA